MRLLNVCMNAVYVLILVGAYVGYRGYSRGKGDVVIKGTALSLVGAILLSSVLALSSVGVFIFPLMLSLLVLLAIFLRRFLG